MAKFEQIPGVLDIYISSGDGAAILFDANIDLTGYTMVTTVDDPAFPGIAVTPTNLAAGQFTLTIAAGAPETNTRWRLRWTPSGGLPRTAYAGALVVSKA